MADQADSLKIMLFALTITLATGNLPWDAMATILVGALLLTAWSYFEPDVKH
jgi:hypothetical protein